MHGPQLPVDAGLASPGRFRVCVADATSKAWGLVRPDTGVAEQSSATPRGRPTSARGAQGTILEGEAWRKWEWECRWARGTGAGHGLVEFSPGTARSEPYCALLEGCQWDLRAGGGQQGRSPAPGVLAADGLAVVHPEQQGLVHFAALC